MDWFSFFGLDLPACGAAERVRLSRLERRVILREMAKGELRCGRISQRRGRELIEYAGSLGIKADEAAELIEEVRRAWEGPTAMCPCSPFGAGGDERRPAVSVWMVVASVLLGAVIFCLLLLRNT